MTRREANAVSFTVDRGQHVSGLFLAPPNARAVFVLAHGAGAGMNHPFLAAMADALAERGVATLRYQFPYMEKGVRRPDTPAVAQATVRAAAADANRLAPRLPLIAGGKSFGGRMTSAAAAAEPLVGVVGIALLGFPLHPPGKPADQRGDHLFDVTVPMLFLQGTRDEFADLSLLEPLVDRLGNRATLRLIKDADHSFRVPARTGRKAADVHGELADSLTEWIDAMIGSSPP